MHRGIIPWNRLEIQGGQWPRFEKSGRTAPRACVIDLSGFRVFFCLLTYVTTVKTEIKESMNDAQFVLTLSRSHTGSTLARTYVCKAEKSLTRLTSKVLWPQKEGYYVGGGCFKLAATTAWIGRMTGEEKVVCRTRIGYTCLGHSVKVGGRRQVAVVAMAAAAVMVTAPYGGIRTPLHYADAF